MTQDEIIEMARQAGWEMDNSCVLSPQVLWYIYQGQLEAFAKLIADAAAAKEREACAKLCETALYQLQETINELSSSEYMEQCVVQGAMNQAVKLTKAIRARGEA